jgi:hypothetical protein
LGRLRILEKESKSTGRAVSE